VAWSLYLSIRCLLYKYSQQQSNRRHQTSPVVCNLPFMADNRLIQYLQVSAPVMRTLLHGPFQFSIHRGVRLVGHAFPQKLPLPLWGSSPACYTLFPGPSPLVIPNSISIDFSRFCMGPKCYAVQCTVNREENCQNCHFPLGFHHPARRGRATAMDNMHKKFGKDHACGSGDILADRQTDRQTHRRAHHNTSQPLQQAGKNSSYLAAKLQE